MNDVITLIQSPIISERLKEISDAATEKCNRALSLECTLDTYKEIKDLRAEINRDFAELEASRKGVEKTVNEALKPFKDTYKALITDVYTQTDSKLKAKIESVTNTIVEENRRKVKEYFDEKALAVFDNNVPDFVDFDRAGITVNMSTSMNKAKKAVDEYLASIKSDIDFIVMSDDTELYSEYVKCSNLTTAQLNLKTRREQAKKAQEYMQTFADTAKEVTKHTEKVRDAALKAPVEAKAVDVTDTSEKLEASFTVRGTLEQLRALKNYMTQEGIEVL